MNDPIDQGIYALLWVETALTRWLDNIWCSTAMFLGKTRASHFYEFHYIGIQGI